jgi:hypothetical protein
MRVDRCDIRHVLAVVVHVQVAGQSERQVGRVGCAQRALCEGGARRVWIAAFVPRALLASSWRCSAVMSRMALQIFILASQDGTGLPSLPIGTCMLGMRLGSHQKQPPFFHSWYVRPR